METIFEKNTQEVGQKIYYEIFYTLNQRAMEDRSDFTTLIIYVLYQIKRYNVKLNTTIESLVSEGIISSEVADEINLTDEEWKSISVYADEFKKDELKYAILFGEAPTGNKNRFIETPKSIIKLANAILNIKDDDFVADYGCAYGKFLIDAALKSPDTSFVGYEIQKRNALISRIRAEILGANMKIECKDLFSAFENDELPRFSKIFANYPFGLRMKNLFWDSKTVELMSKECPRFSNATSLDWAFNFIVCKSLSRDGKAIAIMTNGSTFNSIDKPIRTYFIEKGLIESVISLPSKMFNGTSVSTSMVVFSHNNESVRLINAADICQEGRRFNEFNDSDIDLIMEALNKDSEYSKSFTIEKLVDNEGALYLDRYITEKPSFENSVAFESVINRITRGAGLSAKELDSISSDEETEYQYLMLANIQNGIINDELPYIKSIDNKYEKYCVKNNSLILSKNGYPYKVAVAEVEEGRTILANGNLYIIELDETKINPIYLKAFFESEIGIQMLKSITVGATIPNIGIDKLKKLEIPVPPMEKQLKVANKYKATLESIKILKERLSAELQKLNKVFEEEI